MESASVNDQQEALWSEPLADVVWDASDHISFVVYMLMRPDVLQTKT